MQNTIFKKPNLQIIRIDEGEESQVNYTDQTFIQIIEENILKQEKTYSYQNALY